MLTHLTVLVNQSEKERGKTKRDREFTRYFNRDILNYWAIERKDLAIFCLAIDMLQQTQTLGPDYKWEL